MIKFIFLSISLSFVFDFLLFSVYGILEGKPRHKNKQYMYMRHLPCPDLFTNSTYQNPIKVRFITVLVPKWLLKLKI